MMDFLLDPNVAYVLLVTGFVLAVLALMSPGTGLMEVISLFILFMAGYAMLRLPIHTWALVLIVLSIIPFVISIRLVKRWWLLLLALVILIVGTIFLFRTDTGTPAIHPVLAVVVSASAMLVLWIIGRRGMEAVLLKPSFDMKRLIGQIADARADFVEEGSVYVMGEEWTARSNLPVRQGSQVKVVGREGLVLLVEEVKKADDMSDSGDKPESGE